MLQPPAVALGVHLDVLVSHPKDAAAQVIPTHQVAAASDSTALTQLANRSTVLTFEHEHVPNAELDDLIAAGCQVHPQPHALLHAQNKLIMRQALSAQGYPCPEWVKATNLAEIQAFWQAHQERIVVKAATGGYDGKGVLMVTDAADLVTAGDWVERLGEVLLEEAVDYTRELAVLIARSPSGEARAWPVVESIQINGVCAEVIAPAPNLSAETATKITAQALALAADLDVTGVLAVEGFETADGRFLVNELAMRPHNSGHWTIDGATTSQFEQHLRAVLDLPLGDTSATAPWTVMVNVLGGPCPDQYAQYAAVMAADPAVKVHMYGKAVHPGRKIGHVTVSGPDLAAVRDRAHAAAALLKGAPHDDH